MRSTPYPRASRSSESAIAPLSNFRASRSPLRERSALPSEEPLTRLAPCGRESDLSRKGRGEARLLKSCSALCDVCSQAPAQAAIGASGGRRVAQQLLAELPIGGTVPDLRKGLSLGVTQGEAVIAVHGEGRDAAGKGAPMGGEIHQ